MAKTKEKRPRAYSSIGGTLFRLSVNRTARLAFVVVGTAGLVALSLALVGPRRAERQVYKLRDAIEPRLDKLWADAKPQREQIAELLEKASPEGRKRLVETFHGWIGRFTAG